jgi:hypothetical protein
MLVHGGRWLVIFGAAVLVAASLGSAQARDLFGDDGNYNIMAPEPGTVSYRAAHDRHRTAPRHSQPATPEAAQSATTQGAATQSASGAIDTPEQIENFKHNRGLYASRGSSGLVLPTPVPGPTHYAPIGTPPPPVPSVQEQSPTILPAGRAIPNLPHGPENFQERASRCSFQSSINGIHAGQFGSYMQNCAM